MADSHRERELFDACLRLDPQSWSAYLDQHCPDNQALRERIHRLLRVHLQSHPSTLGLNEISTGQPLPETVGPYRILSVLGEGGMGIVYEAEQTAPVRRRVALKVLRAGMDSQQVMARFAAERQALAVMDHPFIAKVFDAGETPARQPYFVMELVPGTPLSEFCERERLTVRQRVRLFIDICQAVQHAHQKGVIHRDLKPANVLVAADSRTPVPKVIDFGIAKAVEEARDQSGFTRVDQLLGTPAYMSPEQAGVSAGDIDTRTDVYSLGVMLYQLLTGTLPWDPNAVGFGEYLARLARHELEIVKPSRMLQLHGQRSLAKQLRGELDWIILKAMEWDRRLRYEAAATLADDLARYLRDEPVEARPPSVGYRIKKFIHRHRAQAAAAAVALIALAGGGIAATIGLIKATEAEAAARREATSAQETAAFLVSLFEAADPGGFGATGVTVRDLLDRGTARVDQGLKDQPSVRARLLETLGRVNSSLGLYERGKDLAKRSAALASDPLQRAAALHTLGVAEQRLGHFNDAQKALEESLSIRREKLGMESLLVSESLNSLGGLAWQTSRLDDAIRLHKAALAIEERVAGPEHLSVAYSLRGLGLSYEMQKRPDLALRDLRRAQGIFEANLGTDHPVVADNLDSLALAHADRGEYAEARRLHEQAFALRKRLLGSDHPVLGYSLLNLARLATSEGKLKQALPLYEEGLRLWERSLGPRHPKTADLVESLAILHARGGNLAKASPLFERSLSIYQATYGPRHLETLESHRNVAILRTMQNRQAEAIEHLRMAVDGGYEKDIDLDDPLFKPLRGRADFQRLKEEVRQRSGSGSD